MINVFLSYSTRGATSKEWVINFAESLKKFYYLNYSKELKIWYAIRETFTGDDYKKEIHDAIEKSPVFLMILDPAYIDNNPETMEEVEQYKEMRANLKEEEHFIGVIKWRGNKEAELKSFINSNLVVSYFSRFNSDNNEEDLEENSKEYKNEIQNVAKSIRKRELEQSRKNNSQKLIDQLAHYKDIPKIYVTLGNTAWRSVRSQFIKQLSQTLEHDEKLKNVKFLPDDLAKDTVDNVELNELLYQENIYGKECLASMLKESTAVIVPFESSNSSEAEDLLNKIEFQLNTIKSITRVTKLPVTVLTYVPKGLWEIEKFRGQLDDPTYENIKTVKDVNITAFIDSYITEIQSKIAKSAVFSANKDKRIYMIERYNPESNKESPGDAKYETERRDRLEFRKYIASKKFALIPNLKRDAGLKDAVEHHKNSLKISDGVIIYIGYSEGPLWCIDQQSDTYNIILDLNKEIMEKAVYINKLQLIRDREEYFYYKYDVIIDYPEELDMFLWKIQQQ